LHLFDVSFNIIFLIITESIAKKLYHLAEPSAISLEPSSTVDPRFKGQMRPAYVC